MLPRKFLDLDPQKYFFSLFPRGKFPLSYCIPSKRKIPILGLKCNEKIVIFNFKKGLEKKKKKKVLIGHQAEVKELHLTEAEM